MIMRLPVSFFVGASKEQWHLALSSQSTPTSTGTWVRRVYSAYCEQMRMSAAMLALPWLPDLATLSLGPAVAAAAAAATQRRKQQHQAVGPREGRGGGVEVWEWCTGSISSVRGDGGGVRNGPTQLLGAESSALLSYPGIYLFIHGT